MKQGLIQLYCGEGKGKTTAAVGAAIRCAGAGGRVLFYQFLKDGTSSERKILSRLEGVELPDCFYSNKFVWNMTDEEKAAAARFYTVKFNEIMAEAAENKYDMIVLDEIFDASNCGFVPYELVLHFTENKPNETELVMTGRNPGKDLTDLADYVTYMQKVKHPFDRGVPARKMIEY